MKRKSKGFLRVRIVTLHHGDPRWTRDCGEVVIDVLNPPFKWVQMAKKKLRWKVL